MGKSKLNVISVVINGQEYAIRSHLDKHYVLELATYLDDRISAAASEIQNAKPERAAVLAALNIADELFRQREETTKGQIKERTEKIEQLLDRALAMGS